MVKNLVIIPLVHDVIAAEKLCRSNAVPVQVLPMPRALSDECGVVLEIDQSDGTRVGRLLGQAGIRYIIVDNHAEGGRS